MDHTALLVIDAQNEMFAEDNPVYNKDALLENLKNLIEGARSANVPVIFVQHNDRALVAGNHDWQIHMSVQPLNGEAVIQKTTPDSFHKTGLQDALNAKNIQHLVLAGNQTEYCIDTTCRRAYSLGYKVTLAKDGHGTWDSELLTAKQIIDHHNDVLSSFAELKEAKEIQFS
ncbi:cysteine hydrolase family protein [Planococcus liqunii]|uniref:cysteine hydrolase family protein n=1 Tax=Planococcus liqunii TaxID=3058394 RepID=UPI002616F5F6|nr:cysteine hydrolase family protein [Planococcus sp. N056]WKA52785.1 cysteine hydrolase family protein [Planococcus sp. N056]